MARCEDPRLLRGLGTYTDDIRLPDISGFDVCRQLRREGFRQPILMLTALDEPVDKVLGLELGARVHVARLGFLGYAMMSSKDLGEALGLAVMTELPLVVVDVQRGGPSTGLPTKVEQSDLLAALFGQLNIWLIVLLIALLRWPGVSRVIRAQTLTLKQRPFIEAAKVAGASHLRIIFRHIMPNVLPLSFLYMTFRVTSAILHA